MRKDVLTLNVILYRLMFILSTVYFIFWMGKFSRDAEIDLEYLLFPGIYLILLLFSKKMRQEESFLKARNYAVMGIVTLLYGVAFWWFWVYSVSRFIEFGLVNLWDIIIYPGVQAFISLIIFIGYTVCAVKQFKEDRKYKF